MLYRRQILSISTLRKKNVSESGYSGLPASLLTRTSNIFSHLTCQRCQDAPGANLVSQETSRRTAPFLSQHLRCEFALFSTTTSHSTCHSCPGRQTSSYRAIGHGSIRARTSYRAVRRSLGAVDGGYRKQRAKRQTARKQVRFVIW
jgi:hypothetical protein